MNDEYLSVRIDTVHFRVYIHRSTLEAMNKPPFIRLGFHPQSQRLIVLGTWEDEKSAIRVKYSTGVTFCVYSKSLIEGIRMIGDCLKEDGSFLFRGTKERTEPAVSFPMDKACDPTITDRGGTEA